MSNHAEHIHPIFDKLLQKEAKERLLAQKGKVFWLTGLSGSGKSTIAQYAEARLYGEGRLTQVLDGDNIRSGLNKNLSFSEADRAENIRRIAEVAKLFANCGIVTMASFISPTKASREMARSIIGKDNFCEIYVSAPFSVCEDRDVKGLYAKARSGQIKNFTGLDAPYEIPENPDLEIKTNEQSVEESVESLFNFIMEHIKTA